MIFIRHAEKDIDSIHSGLTPEGFEQARAFSPPPASLVLTSAMKRGMQTASILYPDQVVHQVSLLNEYNPDNENAAQFIDRVHKALEFINILDSGLVIISHGKFMNVAYQILTGRISIGFNYLESFEYEKA